MKNVILNAFNEHELWVNSLGDRGKRINVEEEIFSNIEQDNICLSQGSFIECKFLNLHIKQWDFYSAILCSSIFEQSILINSNFVKADLSYSIFHDVTMESINFSKSDMSNCTIIESTITNGKFINALMDCLQFKKTTLINTDFTGAYIENMLLDSNFKMKNVIGLDDAQIQSIQIETSSERIKLEHGEAKSWLQKHNTYN